MPESGEFATTGCLAGHEKIAPFCMTRVMWLALLVPKIVEAILDGQQDAHTGLAALMEPFPMEWCLQ